MSSTIVSTKAFSGNRFHGVIFTLGPYEFMQALKHARNATNGRVEFGGMVFKVGEEMFRDIMAAYFLSSADKSKNLKIFPSW